MKKIIFIILLTFTCESLFAHQEIKPLCNFTVWGIVDLYTNPDFYTKPEYTTLNHEGGLKVRVLKTGNTDINFQNEEGRWIYILTDSPQWTTEAHLIPRNSSYWIFIRENETLFDFQY